MDFIFMLTRADKTVQDCMDVIDLIKDCGIKHIGFKDVGVDTRTLSALALEIRNLGATSYMEVVSTTPDSIRTSIALAAEIGVDRVLGGDDVEFALDSLRGTGAQYYPFPGRPVGHPTTLGGTPEDIANDCARMAKAGCPGVDLLAYRASDCDPLDLIRAARKSLNGGYLIIAGSIDSPQRIQDIRDAGADAFTIGSAIFDGSYAPNKGSIVSQCRDVLEACAQ